MTAAATAFARDGYAATGIRRLAGRPVSPRPRSTTTWARRRTCSSRSCARRSSRLLRRRGRARRRGAAARRRARRPRRAPGVGARHPARGDARRRHGGPRAPRPARGRTVLALRDRYEAVWHGVVAGGARAGAFDVRGRLADDEGAARPRRAGLPVVRTRRAPARSRSVCARHAELGARHGPRPAPRATSWSSRRRPHRLSA